MRLVVFGLSLSSSWGNGHATTYRALLRAFAARGHQVTFFEWDAPWYGGAHRDLRDPDFCRLVLYPSWSEVRRTAIGEAATADAVIVGSYVHDGPRVIDDLAAAGAGPLYFYDIDTPVTVAQLRRGGADCLRADQVPLFATYLSFTGGPWLDEVLVGELGAKEARPLYCSVDEERYRPVDPEPDLAADLAYMGTYAPDRQPVLDRFLVAPARELPRLRFLVAGPQYPAELTWPANVRRWDHVPPSRHPAFYASSAWQLNATRADMVAAGWSPSVRLFEAAACGAPVISDRWAGIESFFTPSEEILVPERASEVVEILTDYSPEDRERIGRAAQRRVLEAHTSRQRAIELESLLTPAVASA